MAAPTLTRDQIAALAYQAGFRGQGLANIVAITLAESGGDPQAYNPETAAGAAQGMGSVGLTQIYQTAHPQYGRQDLEDPLTNLQAAYAVSNEGQSFTPWSTWNNGTAQQYLTNGTGGHTMGQNQAGETPRQSNPILDEIRQKKGPEATVTQIGKETVTDPDTGMATPNPSPTYRYQWADGTYLDVATGPGGDGVQGGTALAALKQPAAASSRPSGTNVKDQYVYNPATSQFEDNPNYQQNLVPGEKRGGGERDPGTPTDVYNAQTSRQNADTSAQNAQTTADNVTADNKLNQAKFADAQQQQVVDNALNEAKYQLDVTKNQIAQSNLSLLEKQFAYNQAKDKIEQDLQRTTQALTQRGQEVSIRGQNLSMATQLGTDASQATTAALPYMAPVGTGAALARAAQQAQTGGTVDATLPTAQFPYNPQDIAWQVTQHALAALPQFGQAAQAPAPVPLGGPQFGR